MRSGLCAIQERRPKTQCGGLQPAGEQDRCPAMGSVGHVLNQAGSHWRIIEGKGQSALACGLCLGFGPGKINLYSVLGLSPHIA